MAACRSRSFGRCVKAIAIHALAVVPRQPWVVASTGGWYSLRVEEGQPAWRRGVSPASIS